MRRLLLPIAAAALVAGACGQAEYPALLDEVPTEAGPTTTFEPIGGNPGLGGDDGDGDAADDDDGSFGADGDVAVPVVATGDWVDITANLVGLQSTCGNVSFVSAHPETDAVLANVSQNGLFTLADDASGWEEIGQGGAAIDHRTQWVQFDPEDADRYWVSGAYGQGVFRTNDGGRSFSSLGTLQHVDHVAIDVDDPERRTLLAGIHEERAMMLSSNGGSTWTDISDTLPEQVGLTASPAIIDAAFLVGSYRGDEAGIYRSEDGGETWDPVFQRGVLGVPVVADDYIAWNVESKTGGLAISRDGGLTFELSGAGSGAPSTTLIEIEEGLLVTTARLGVAVSDDMGDSWNVVGPDLPFQPVGVAYSPARSAIYAWTFTCNFGADGNPVLEQSIMQLEVEVGAGAEA